MKNLYFTSLVLTILFFLTSSWFTLSSAQNYYYVANPGSTLALSEKNSLKFSYAVEELDGINGERLADYYRSSDKFTYHLALGYSPIKHLAVQSSFYKHSSYYYFYENLHGYIGNIAVGAYHFLPKKKLIRRKKDIKRLGIRSGWLFDGYVGLERGKINNFYDSFLFYPPNENSPNSQFTFLKTYAQLGIHWQGRIAFSYTFTVANLNFTKGNIHKHVELFERDKIDLDKILFDDPFTLHEHNLKVHFGSRYIRFFGLMSLSFSNKLYRYGGNGTIMLGTTIHIGKFYTERISKK